MHNFSASTDELWKLHSFSSLGNSTYWWKNRGTHEKECQPSTTLASVNTPKTVGWNLGTSLFLCEYGSKTQERHWSAYYIQWISFNNALEPMTKNLKNRHSVWCQIFLQWLMKVRQLTIHSQMCYVDNKQKLMKLLVSLFNLVNYITYRQVKVWMSCMGKGK